MLGHCSAFVIARAGERDRSLELLAREAGFGTVTSTARRQSGEAIGAKRAVAYFLMDGHLDEAAMKHTLGAVRLSPDPGVCFAPVVLFIEDGPFETYIHYVQMGFDDVITIPEKREILIQRLDGQLGEHVYFRTPTYLGPDRRRFDLLTTPHERRGQGPSDHDQISIVRSAITGVSIARTRRFIGSHPARIAS